MTWLYSIIFAGLLFSGSNDADTSSAAQPPAQTIESRIVQNDVTEKIDQTYPLNPNGKVSLCNVNGPIVIEAWDRNEVHLEATKIADSRESLSKVNINVDARPDNIRIETDYEPWNHRDKSDQNQYRKLEVHYRLQVPRTAVLGEVEAVNGSVTVSNFTNLTKVSTVNGNVNATNLRGTAKLSTVNGQVYANFDRIEPGTSISLNTVNGKVNLEVPSDINATLKAESLNGNISNDFGLPVKKGKYVGRSLHGRIGSGEVQIKLDSVNGGLAIGRRKDGRSPASVTNLLRTTDDDSDSDTEDSNEVSVSDPRRMNREIAKSVKSSTKENEKQLKESHKTIEKAKAGMEKIEAPTLPDISVVVDSEMVRKAIADGVRSQARAVAGVGDAIFESLPTLITRQTNSFEFKGSPEVKVDAGNCKVRLRGWNQPVVKYVLTESRNNQRNPVSIVENADAGSVTLKVKEPARSAPGVSWSQDRKIWLDVFVPRKSNVTVSSAEEIRVEGVSGKLDVQGEDSAVSIRDSEGSLHLSSADALVRVIGFKGELDLEAGDGDVFLEGDFEKIVSTAEDASITLTVPADRNASISTNAAIESEGLNIVRDNGRTWRLGNGGSKYNFDFADGRLVVRNSALVETN